MLFIILLPFYFIPQLSTFTSICCYALCPLIQFSFSNFYINAIIQCIFFLSGFFYSNRMILRFTHVVVYIRVPQQFDTVWICQNVPPICSSVDEPLDCFQFRAIINKAIQKICMHVFSKNFYFCSFGKYLKVKWLITRQVYV